MPFKKIRTDSQFVNTMIILGIISFIGAILFLLIAYILVGLNKDIRVEIPDNSISLNRYTNRVVVSEKEIDLGNEYNGKYYDGYNDPIQKAMAQELLELYYTSVDKNRELLTTEGFGFDKSNVIEFLIGIHIRETGTYSNHTPIDTNTYGDKAPKTYIPLNFVKWGAYSRGKTVDGKTMNFTNYSWRDAENQRLKLNPSNQYPSKGSNLYYAEVSYKGLKSVAGALGPIQMIPATWHYNQAYLKGDKWSSVNPGWISDIESYIKSATANHKDSEAASTYDDGGEYDIFNFPDQLVGVLKWTQYYAKYVLKLDSNFKDLKDQRAKLALMAMSFNLGASQLMNILGNNGVEFGNDLAQILSDELFYEQLDKLYESQKGRGVADYNLIIEKFKSIGFEESGNSLRKQYSSGTVQFSKDAIIYGVSAITSGRSWHSFLKGIAYGGTTKTPNSGGLNKVVYNYMTQNNPYRNRNQNIRSESLDSVMAIGYKGNIPIFDQGGDYMKQFRMLYPADSKGERTFYRMACTVFTMTSIQHATGNYILPKEHSYMDLDKNGKIDPVEFWGQGVGLMGQEPFNPRDFSYKPKSGKISTIALGNLMKKLGYVVEFTDQGTYQGNQDIINRLKNGIPTTIRIVNKRAIRALVPKQDPDKINYFTFDMYDRDNYVNGSKILANIGHTVLGVDARQFDGKWYISIVDSSYHHLSGADSNLCWFEADSILSDRYAMNYSIVGSTDPNWKPNLMDKNYIPDEEKTEGYIGVEYTDALNSMSSVEFYFEDSKTGRIINKSSNNTIVIEGKYKTQAKNGNLYLYIGQINNSDIVLEFSNITNPRNNDLLGVREMTELFNLTPGNRAYVRIGTLDEKGNIYYDSFFDE